VIVQVRGIHHVNVHQLHLADPSGNRIELNEPGV
jgi:hypothetical protein